MLPKPIQVRPLKSFEKSVKLIYYVHLDDKIGL
jgi:hypothetical protein